MKQVNINQFTEQELNDIQNSLSSTISGMWVAKNNDQHRLKDLWIKINKIVNERQVEKSI